MSDPRPYSDHTAKPEGGNFHSPTAAYVPVGPVPYYQPVPAAPQPLRCGHYFPYWSVIPPSYCPLCGAYIGPIYTAPQPPVYQITFTTRTGVGTAAPPKPQGETICGD